MPSTSIIFGALLILLGILSYVYVLTTPNPSPTALIPAFFGIVLVLLGVVARAKENLRKHLMHAAVIVALLGFLGTVSSFLKIPSLFEGTAARPVAVVAQLITAIICLVFIILSVRSFIDARKNRA
jgi:prolipoprotein diacylglyceryltransferase